MHNIIDSVGMVVQDINQAMDSHKALHTSLSQASNGMSFRSMSEKYAVCTRYFVVFFLCVTHERHPIAQGMGCHIQLHIELHFPGFLLQSCWYSAHLPLASQ